MSIVNTRSTGARSKRYERDKNDVPQFIWRDLQRERAGRAERLIVECAVCGATRPGAVTQDEHCERCGGPVYQRRFPVPAA